MQREGKERALVWLCFLTSVSTLFCCTLPIMFVALGFGATLAAIVYHVEWLTVLTIYKFWLFLISGLLLLITNWLLNRSGRLCPSDPVLAKKCLRVTKWNYRLLYLSVVMWIIGFISAYLAIPISIWLGWQS